MAAIRSRNTKPELLLRQALRAEGLVGYRCHHPRLPGKPDIVFTRWRVVALVDGVYWHGHPDHFTFGRDDYWDTKVRRTQERDRIQEQELQEMGYTVLRFWDLDVKQDVAACVRLIRDALRENGAPY